MSDGRKTCFYRFSGHGADVDSLHRHPEPFQYRILPRDPRMNPEKLEGLIAANTP